MFVCSSIFRANCHNHVPKTVDLLHHPGVHSLHLHHYAIMDRILDRPQGRTRSYRPRNYDSSDDGLYARKRQQQLAKGHVS